MGEIQPYFFHFFKPQSDPDPDDKLVQQNGVQEDKLH